MTIKLDNITKYYYSTNSITQALRNINLEFRIGEFVAITGESGSGKSTLLNIISGMNTYDDGELYIDGEATSHYDSDDWEEYRTNRMGFIFQSYNLIENYSALYNVESSLIIQGYGNKEAKKIAKELLNKVGLKKQAKHKTSRLSSGQKQRLSIARALAKNTDIIVADEPTGNLDSENGRQIMELFSMLSKDKLVIVVTHNYEEASPFVTRKIRLHDGEVVSDTPVNCISTENENGLCINAANTTGIELQKEEIIDHSDISSDNKNSHNKFGNISKTNRRIAWRFTLMNITTQLRRVMLFFVFLLFTAIVTFLFLGEIYRNWDDIYTKNYDNSAFLNSDITRIVVKNKDGSEITGEDINCFNEIKYVKMSDMYGFSNDIHYCIKDKETNEYVYNLNDNLNANENATEDSFFNTRDFVKSSTCITEADLRTGRLPKSRNEVVLYSEDANDLGKEKLCYFTNLNTWGRNQYYSIPVKVVGLLNEESNQVYFSGELCNILSFDLYGDHFMMSLCWNVFENKWATSASFIPVIGDGLTSYTDPGGKEVCEVRVSPYLVLPSDYSAQGIALIDVFKNNGNNDTVSDVKLNAIVLDQYNEFSPGFIELSEDSFYQLFTYKSIQASIYIKDYIYMDRVLSALKKQGYDAISSYRTCAVEYDDMKVADRNIIIIKALIVLLMVSILEIIIIKSIFKLKQKEYYILGSMGMNHTTIKLINYYEMFIYTVLSILIVPTVAKIASLYQSGYLPNMMKYYNAFTLLIYGILNLLTITITVWSFNRYLRRRQKRSMYDTAE